MTIRNIHGDVIFPRCLSCGSISPEFYLSRDVCCEIDFDILEVVTDLSSQFVFDVMGRHRIPFTRDGM